MLLWPCCGHGAPVSHAFLTVQALELLCPAVIMLLIGTIKTAITSEVTEAGMPATDTPVPTYESMQGMPNFPNVLCYDNNMFMRHVRRLDTCGCFILRISWARVRKVFLNFDTLTINSFDRKPRNYLDMTQKQTSDPGRSV